MSLSAVPVTRATRYPWRSSSGKAVVTRDRVRERLGRNADRLRERLERMRLPQVTVSQRSAQIDAARSHHAEPVFGDERVIADEKAGLAWRACEQHGLGKSVIVHGFGDEAAPQRVHGDEARLAAIEHEVRKDGERVVTAAAHRHRRPEAVAVADAQASAHLLGERNAVALRAFGNRTGESATIGAISLRAEQAAAAGRRRARTR